MKSGIGSAISARKSNASESRGDKKQYGHEVANNVGFVKGTDYRMASGAKGSKQGPCNSKKAPEY